MLEGTLTEGGDLPPQQTQFGLSLCPSAPLRLLYRPLTLQLVDLLRREPQDLGEHFIRVLSEKRWMTSDNTWSLRVFDWYPA